MKKVVTILSSIGLIATTGITVVACKTLSELKQKLEEPRNEPKLEEPKQPDGPKKPGNQPQSDDPDLHNQQPQADQPTPDQPKNDNEQNLNNNSGHSNNSSNSEEQPQSDEPQVSGETLKRTKEENFGLIKQYGSELSELLKTLDSKSEKNIEDNDKLKIVATLLQFYNNIMQYSNFSQFEEALKEKLKNGPTSIKDFINEIENELEKIIQEYEKEKNEILEILKK
ncbi:lipoprotein [Mycoplasma feriruminatoris]|uniref:Lipoprotein n=1 Tax=Mycoplasma feriruminatoris TaxID=1179777 RepID=A0A654IJ08_9MOLU|nr:lipoprotein [Mycoplasma feriruminatoris]WFQ90329.1 hypothetical protein MFERI11561_00583 [Mycoplasma feriruminatoris]VZR98130.1 hypothetical protein MF5295_00638 [Mycoplasma feriruminatoris]